MRPFLRSLLPLCAVLAGARLVAMNGVLEKLAKNSPFGSVDATGPAAADPEFRGYYAESGEQFFCIYDPASRHSVWLRRDETGEPFVARKFSESQLLLNIEYKGRSLALHMVQAKVTALAPPPPPAPAATVPAQGTAVGSKPDAVPVGEVAVAEKKLAEALENQAAIQDRVRLAAERRRQLQIQAGRNP